MLLRAGKVWLSGAAIALLSVMLLASYAIAQIVPSPGDDIVKLTGHFWVLFIDRQDGRDMAPEFWLQASQGKQIRLNLTTEQTETFGGTGKMNGKPFVVEGTYTDKGKTSLQVTSLETGRPDRLEAVSPSSRTRFDPVSGTKPWATILVRFSDSTNVTPHPKSYYDNLMGTAYPGMDHYWREQSYNQLNLTGNQVVGWYNLPHPRSYYETPNVGCGYDSDKLVADAVAVSDAAVNFANFYGFNLMFNQDIGSAACGTSNWYGTFDGQTRYWGVTWMPTWSQNASTTNHEMGHGWGLDHTSGPYTETYDSHWDVMSSGAAPNATYTWVGVHVNAYHKDVAGWIPPGRKLIVRPGTSQTATIERIVQPVSGSNYLMAQVFIGGWATRFYTLEARRFAGYDASSGIPGEAIVIHKVDTTLPDRQSQVVDVDNNGNCNDAGAMWTAGETFTDSTNKITIRVNSVSASAFNVTITDASTHTPNIVSHSGDVGPGSLRNALLWANYVGDSIGFRIPHSDPNYTNGVVTLLPASSLPEITRNGIVVDGTTQTSSLGNSNPNGPEILLDGTNAGGYTHGFQTRAGSTVFKGLAVGDFSQTGIVFYGPGTVLGKVAGCYIGTNATGTAALPNGWAGVGTWAGAQNIQIGGTTAEEGNLISGNTSYGIFIADQGTGNIRSVGNRIGTDRTGATALPNGYAGVGIVTGADHCTIGGTLTGARNLISGNAAVGVLIADAGSDSNLVQGNYIGTDIMGTLTLPNGYDGVSLVNGAKNNVIGGATPEARNLLSGNSSNGVYIGDPGTSNNVIIGNYIGTDVTGLLDVGNGWAGVFIGRGANNNRIGGPTPAERNILSGNNSQGVGLADPNTANNRILGNYIGVDVTGMASLGNGYSGISIYSGASNNRIGGPNIGEQNLISGNNSPGIGIWDPNSAGNIIQGNYIGTDVTGRFAVANGWTGVALLNGAAANSVGGSNSGEGNLISGNAGDGVTIGYTNADGIAPSNNVVQGNLIGTDVTGLIGIPNGYSAVSLFSGAHHNVIGSPASGLIIPGAANTLAFNPYNGIWLNDPGTVSNTFRGNAIYQNGFIGINLVGGSENGYWVTANDVLDSDTGPNNLMNYPLLTGSTISNGVVTINGTLNSRGNANFKIDLYRSDTADPSGNGEGAGYLGTVSVTTNGSGNASFSFNCLSSGPVITATATDVQTGDTSEFSPVLTLATAMTATVSGTVQLEDCVQRSQVVTFEFRRASSSFQRTTLLDANGHYSLTGIPRTSYSVWVKGAKWLLKIITVNTTSGNVTTANVSLLGGDSNNDNSVDVLDLDALISAFDSSPGNGPWNVLADFNCDDSVDVFDLDLLIRNFDKSGD